MSGKKLILISLLFCASAFFYFSPAVAGENESRCIDLLIGKCRECHYLTRICQNLDRKSKWKWKRTIKNMTNKGAEVTREQEDRLLECLADKAPDVVEFCRNPPPLSSMAPLRYPDGVKKNQ